MSRRTRGSARFCALVALALLGGACSMTPRAAAPVPGPTSDNDVIGALHQLRLSFVENRGQVDGPVSYYVPGADTSLYFGSDGVTFALSGGSAEPPKDRSALRDRHGAVERWAVKLDFVGANQGAPHGGDARRGGRELLR